jgi:hypothetical protein
MDGNSVNTEIPINNDSTNKIRHGYFGAPFSYYGSFKELERGEVRDVLINEGIESRNEGHYRDL